MSLLIATRADKRSAGERFCQNSKSHCSASSKFLARWATILFFLSSERCLIPIDSIIPDFLIWDKQTSGANKTIVLLSQKEYACLKKTFSSRAGLMARNNHFETIVQAVTASLLVTLANSLLGAVIATYLYGGITGVVDFAKMLCKMEICYDSLKACYFNKKY